MGPLCPCSCPDTSSRHGTTHQLHNPGYSSLPIPSPHLQQIPPCFPSVLTSYQTAAAKQRQISNTSSSGLWITETAAGIRHSLLNPCEQLLLSTEDIHITRHKVLHSISHKELQRTFKLPNVLFPTYLAVDTVNPCHTVDCSSLRMGSSACPAGHRAQCFRHSHPQPFQAPLLIKKELKSTV